MNTEGGELSDRDVQVKLAEYERAQDMLKHYDSLNWQIGSILIGANAVLLGLVANLLPKTGWWGLLVAVTVASFSWKLLDAWKRWFDRHRDLYNFRNETLQRIETQLGMYHFLRAVEGDKKLLLENVDQERPGDEGRLQEARRRAYAGAANGPDFRPFYLKNGLREGAGHKIAEELSLWVPGLEFLVLAAIVIALNA